MKATSTTQPIPGKDDDQYIALLISSQGEKEAIRLVDFMRRSGLTSDCYAYKFRVKSKSDILSKKSRKIEKKPQYKLIDITDVIGVRLVTLFKSDMLKAYEVLIDTLAKPKPGSEFHSAAPEEIIVYKGTSALDELSNEIKSITRKSFRGATIRSENSVEGYSSIHVICRHINNIEELDCANGPYRLPIEVQIRTVFEDAWGEIDHKYGYTIREGKEAGTPINNSHHIKSHLKVLKGFTDACMEYAESIKREATPEILDVTTGASKTISVESDEDVLNRFREIGMKEDFIQKYVEARATREKAAEEIGHPAEGRGGFVQTYLQAADLFAGLCSELAPGDTALTLKDGPKLAYYYCAMNEGLCLMSTNAPDSVNAAVAKYQFIESHYKNFPLAKLRLGQALGKVGRLDEAIEKLRSAGTAFKKVAEKALENDEWPDHLPRTDYEHMLYTQPKILGFLLWKKTQLPSGLTNQEKAELFYEAYETTLECVAAAAGDSKRLLDAHNNLLYYCVGFVFFVDDADERTQAVRSKIPDLLDRMCSDAGGLEKLSIEDLDTVFRARALLEDPSAKDIASDLIKRCLRKDSGSMDPNLRLSISEVAQEYIDSGTIFAM